MSEDVSRASTSTDQTLNDMNQRDRKICRPSLRNLYVLLVLLIFTDSCKASDYKNHITIPPELFKVSEILQFKLTFYEHADMSQARLISPKGQLIKCIN